MHQTVEKLTSLNAGPVDFSSAYAEWQTSWNFLC